MVKNLPFKEALYSLTQTMNFLLQELLFLYNHRTSIDGCYALNKLHSLTLNCGYASINEFLPMLIRVPINLGKVIKITE